MIVQEKKDEELSENIQVYLRLRPPSNDELQSGPTGGAPVLQAVTDKTVTLKPFGLNSSSSATSFTFDAVGDANVGQEQVFKVVGKPITDICLQGYNGTIFAYGQTGSGKTYTMQGPDDPLTGCISQPHRGVISRCFEYLFAMMNREEKKSGGCVSYLCRASFCEIYNEIVYDLLDSSAPACYIREDIKKGVYVDGLSEEHVSSPLDCQNLLELGSRNRHVAETSMNRESSRSHSVFTLFIQSKVTNDDIIDVRESRFNLVDLAGSERQKSTATSGSRLKEAGNINKSLLALGNVINALVDISNGKPRHINYRDSKLTFLLRDSLGGNARTFLIANASPCASSYGETLSTLRFASRAKQIRNRAIVNQELQGNLFQLQEEIKRLKHELLLSKAQQQSSSTSLFVEFGDLREDMSNIEDNERRLMAVLAEVLKRYRDSEAESKSLWERIDSLEKVIESQKCQIQTDKMIIKFRDDSIRMLRSRTINASQAADTERDHLRQEIDKLNEVVKFHPEMNRFVAENLELRSTLDRFEEHLSDIQRMEELKAEWKVYELALASQIVQYEVRLKEASNGRINETITITQETQEQIDALKARNRNLQTELEIANRRIEEMNEEAGKLQTSAEELEGTIDKIRVDSSATLSTDGMNNNNFLEAIHSQLTDIRLENHRLKEQLNVFETKARRLSDFANESRKSSQAQISTLSNSLDKSESKVTELEVELKSASDYIASLKNSIGEYEAVEQDLLSMTSKFQQKENQLDKALEDIRNLQDEVADITVLADISRKELDQERAQVQDLVEKLQQRDVELKAVTTRNVSMAEQLVQLQTTLEKNDGDASAELTKLNQEVLSLKNKTEDLQEALHGRQVELAELSAQVFKTAKERDDTLLLLEVERQNVADGFSKLTAKRQELDDINNTVTDLSQECDSLKTSVLDLESQLKEANDMLESVKHSTRVEIQEQESRRHNEKEKLMAQLEMAESDNKVLLNQLKAKDDLESNAKRTVELEGKVQQLELELENKENTCRKTQDQLDKEQSRIQAIMENLGRLDELQGKNNSLEQQLDYILRRNEELEEANGKLVKHNNFKQKLQYHLQIKQENNQLRADNQKLATELEKLRQSIREDAPHPILSRRQTVNNTHKK